MNKMRLNQLFSNYIEKFEYINNPENNETYKWAAVEQYRESFNLEAPDLSGMLYEAWKASENLIDSANQQPFYALVSYAKEEPETVRKMFRDLFAEDGGNLAERQAKIIAFIQSSEELKEKYAPGSWRYTNDQRSVMAYLFFHDPEHNYLYKATQAHEFADCVEFLDDWGAGANFKLDVYYRMCDELVAAMKEFPALIQTHMSRYEDAEEQLYEDPSYHVLAFDMIYSSQVYNLYDGIQYSHPKGVEKKLYRERIEKAATLKEAYEQARADFEHLEEVRAVLLSHLQAGASLIHKIYGVGTIVSTDGSSVTIQYPTQPEPKKFMLLPSLGGGFLKTGTEDDFLIQANAKLLQMDGKLEGRLKSAEAALEPYLQYL